MRQRRKNSYPPPRWRRRLGVRAPDERPAGAGVGPRDQGGDDVTERAADAICASLQGAGRGESLGARSPVVGFHVVGVQAVEEFPDRPLGSEHVKGRMLPMLRNDLVFALRF